MCLSISDIVRILNASYFRTIFMKMNSTYFTTRTIYCPLATRNLLCVSSAQSTRLAGRVRKVYNHHLFIDFREATNWAEYDDGDGSQWIVEGIDRNGYHYVNRSSPEDGPVRAFGDFALLLTGWTFEERY